MNTSMHAVRGFFRFAHIDALIRSHTAAYAQLPRVESDESRTQGLDRLELIRFRQVTQTITVHHGALAHLLGTNALRASEAAAVRIEDYQDTCVAIGSCTWVGKGNKPATMPITRPRCSGCPRPVVANASRVPWCPGRCLGSPPIGVMPVLRVLEACLGERTDGSLILRPL